MLTTAHRFLTVQQVANRLELHPQTIYKLIWAGQLPAVQPGGPGHSLRIDEEELERWLSGSARNGGEAA